MINPASFAPLLERYFTQRLMRERQASPHTISSYRDTFRQFLEAQACRRLMQPLLNKLQELTKGVAIGTDGVWTRLALLHQPLSKVALQQRGKAGGGDHD